MTHATDTTDPTLDERLAAAEANEALESAKVEAATKLRRLLVLDLRAKYRAEEGTEGRDFVVLEFSALDAVIALKRVELVVVKAFDKATEKNAASHEQTVSYVTPSLLHPKLPEFRALVDKHPKVAMECAGALRELEGLRLQERAGK